MGEKAKKGKKGLVSLVFSRIFIFGLMILAQITFMMFIYLNVTSYTGYLNTILHVIAFFLVICIVSEQKTDPTTRLLWSVLILVVPVLGTLLYLYVKMAFGAAYLKTKIEDISEITGGYLAPDRTVYDRLKEDSENTYGLAKYLYNYSGYPIYDNSEVTYFKSGEEKWGSLLKDLETAQSFIFLEYFIIERGQVWDSILEILQRKQKEGVEVRVMYDGMCSLIQLPMGYYKTLSKIGIQSKAFAPMRPFLSTYQNNRDHRKIAIIDGKIAYTGGINLADEYMNLKERFGYWKDVAIRIEGPAVQSFTLMFLRMWCIDKSQVEQFNKYIDIDYSHYIEDDENKGYVAGFSDEPYDYENISEQSYIHILNTAKKYVHIISPYLVIDNVTMTALKFAAKRGVDVKLVLPGVPDKKYVYCVARTYYEELIEAGVKIYEYTPGFTHAKFIVSDDMIATVGTINLDYRSFYLHFECGAVIFKNTVIDDIEKDFVETVNQSRLVTMMECRNRSLLYKFSGKLLRMIAPLL